MSANFELIDNRIIMGTVECINCNPRGSGKRSGRITCPTCNGTGRGIRGGKDGCKQCHGFKFVYSTSNPVDCFCVEKWGTPGIAEATIYDSIDMEELNIPINVIRENRNATWNEQWLGIGSLWSTNWYRDANNLSDDDLRDEVKSNSSWHHVQVCKLVKSTENNREGQLADYIALIVRRDGYTLKAGFEV